MSSLFQFLRSCTVRVDLPRTLCITASVRCLSSVNTYITVPVTSHLNVSSFESTEELFKCKSALISARAQYGLFVTPCSNGQQVNIKYHLPTVWYNGTVKKSILDPLSGLRAYDLPTFYGIVDVKEMPAVSKVSVPVTDPRSTPVVEKVTLPYLMTIRHKKMKKHQRRKLRKRMRFVRRRRKAEKRRRREREIQAYERKMAMEAADYDSDKFVEGQLLKARSAGWGIDIIAEYAKKRATVGGQNSNEK